MLYLLFRLGHERYAISTSDVVEIIPSVEWKTIPQAATGILGVFNYRNQIVPLVDLSEFIVGQPSRLMMSTRIILIRCPEPLDQHEDSENESAPRLLGVLAQEVTRTFRAIESEFVEPGVGVGDAPYLGPVLPNDEGIIQLLDVQSLLPGAVREQLFRSVQTLERA